MVVSATPADLPALIRIRMPVIRARYEFADPPDAALAGHIERFLCDRRLISH
jgi:hypothetical protein